MKRLGKVLQIAEQRGPSESRMGGGRDCFKPKGKEWSVCQQLATHGKPQAKVNPEVAETEILSDKKGRSKGKRNPACTQQGMGRA